MTFGDEMAQQVGVNFDPDTLELLKKVLVEVEQSIPLEARTSAVRVHLACGILKAARNGERNPRRLRSASLLGLHDLNLPVHAPSWVE